MCITVSCSSANLSVFKPNTTHLNEVINTLERVLVKEVNSFAHLGEKPAHISFSEVGDRDFFVVHLCLDMRARARVCV